MTLRLVFVGLVRVLVAAALVAATGEAVMRRYCYSPRILDPEFGFVPAGNPSICRKEGDGVGHWGKRGIRRSPGRLASQPAILVLGDSLTEAEQVDDDETYTYLLEQRLAHEGLPYAVLNAGIEGLALPYYVETADAYIRAFSPRWTIVAISADDVAGSAFLSIATHFIKEPDGTLGIKANPPVGRGGPIRRFIRYARGHSALLQNYVLQEQGYARDMRGFRPFVATQKKDDPPLSHPERFPVRQELAMLEDRFEGRVTILFFSGLRSEDPDEESPMGRAILDICAAEKWSCRSTQEFSRRFAAAGTAPNGFPNSGFNLGHLNEQGHAAVAALLNDEMQKLAQHGLF
jgi:hypothetical protein